MNNQIQHMLNTKFQQLYAKLAQAKTPQIPKSLTPIKPPLENKKPFVGNSISELFERLTTKKPTPTQQPQAQQMQQNELTEHLGLDQVAEEQAVAEEEHHEEVKQQTPPPMKKTVIKKEKSQYKPQPPAPHLRTKPPHKSAEWNNCQIVDIGFPAPVSKGVRKYKVKILYTDPAGKMRSAYISFGDKSHIDYVENGKQETQLTNLSRLKSSLQHLENPFRPVFYVFHLLNKGPSLTDNYKELRQKYNLVI